jgi:hypothetical protein
VYYTVTNEEQNMSDRRLGALTGRQQVTRVLIAFFSGVLAVLLFHQGVLTILHAVGFTSRTPFPIEPTNTMGLPQVWSLAFWGGVWGVVFSLVDRRFPGGAGYWLCALAFGAIGPSLVAWLVVLPLKGMPAGGGWQLKGLAFGLMVNGAWGLGHALIFRGLTSGWMHREHSTRTA